MFPRLSELTASAQSVAEDTITEVRRTGDMADLIEKFQDKNKIYSFEGSRGERNFEKIVNVLGYRSMSEFFEDNSGCFEAMVEWLGGQRNPEWIAAMEAEVGSEVGSEGDGDGDDDDEVKEALAEAKASVKAYKLELKPKGVAFDDMSSRQKEALLFGEDEGDDSWAQNQDVVTIEYISLKGTTLYVYPMSFSEPDAALQKRLQSSLDSWKVKRKTVETTRAR
jgi:hypothetical protein